jgi:hypothetical protein
LQVNQVSNFLDLSQVYNSRKNLSDAFNRDLTNRDKLLEASGTKLLPPCFISNPPAAQAGLVSGE